MVGYGEFLENNRTLVPSGFVEEWWSQLLAKKLKTIEDEGRVPLFSIPQERLHSLATDPLGTKLSAKEALEISRIFNVPLHPLHTLFWDAIKPNELQYLRERILQFSKPSEETIRIPKDAMLQSLLKGLFLPHKDQGSCVHIEE